MVRLRVAAFVALLALVSCALLPLAHGATAHAGDCGVCSSISHGVAGVADSVPAADLPFAAACATVDRLEPARPLPWRGFDVRSARAPPASSLTA